MKTYNNIVIILTCILVGFCACLIIWAQPLSGDLTRIGAYPERWYGWNVPQQKIPASALFLRTNHRALKYVFLRWFVLRNRALAGVPQ